MTPSQLRRRIRKIQQADRNMRRLTGRHRRLSARNWRRLLYWMNTSAELCARCYRQGVEHPHLIALLDSWGEKLAVLSDTV